MMICFYEYSKEAVAMVDPNFFNDVPIFELLIFKAGDPEGNGD
jgi:hypothetical protein